MLSGVDYDLLQTRRPSRPVYRREFRKIGPSTDNVKEF